MSEQLCPTCKSTRVSFQVTYYPNEDLVGDHDGGPSWCYDCENEEGPMFLRSGEQKYLITAQDVLDSAVAHLRATAQEGDATDEALRLIWTFTGAADELPE